MDRYLSVKFGVNPLGGFRENDVYGWTDDGRCCAVAQSRAKKLVSWFGVMSISVLVSDISGDQLAQ